MDKQLQVVVGLLWLGVCSVGCTPGRDQKAIAEADAAIAAHKTLLSSVQNATTADRSLDSRRRAEILSPMLSFFARPANGLSAPLAEVRTHLDQANRAWGEYFSTKESRDSLDAQRSLTPLSENPMVKALSAAEDMQIEMLRKLMEDALKRAAHGIDKAEATVSAYKR